MNAGRRFVQLALGLAVSLVGGVALLNFLVDPYDRFGVNHLGVYISAERESKNVEVERHPHNALLLGNSRIAMLPAGQLQGFRFFNAAFGGGTLEEAYYFLKHHGHSGDLVILGIDLGHSDPPVPQGDIFAPAGLSVSFDNLLSLQTTEYSIRTIFEHGRGKPATLEPDGSYHSADWFRLYDRENPARVAWQVAELERASDAWQCPSSGQMSFCRKVAELARDRGLKCIVVVPPIYEPVAKHIQASPAMPGYQAWLRELKSIFPSVVDLSFGPYCAPDNFFKSDPVHIKPDIGARMLNTEVIPLALQTARGSSEAGHP